MVITIDSAGNMYFECNRVGNYAGDADKFSTMALKELEILAAEYESRANIKSNQNWILKMEGFKLRAICNIMMMKGSIQRAALSSYHSRIC